MVEENKWTVLQKLIQTIEGDISRGHLSAEEIRAILKVEYEISEEHLPCMRTIQRWRKLPGWNDAIWSECYEESKIKLKSVLKTAFEKAIDGDHNWGKMVFSIFEKFPSKKVDLGSTDQWKTLFGDCVTEDKNSDVED